MSIDNGNAPAMPHLMKVGDTAKSEGGLTKREYFAGLAMQALSTADNQFAMTERDIAAHAVTQADALLAKLDKEPSQ